jgi:hypothetical protein
MSAIIRSAHFAGAEAWYSPTAEAYDIHERDKDALYCRQRIGALRRLASGDIDGSLQASLKVLAGTETARGSFDEADALVGLLKQSSFAGDRLGARRLIEEATGTLEAALCFAPAEREDAAAVAGWIGDGRGREPRLESRVRRSAGQGGSRRAPGQRRHSGCRQRFECRQGRTGRRSGSGRANGDLVALPALLAESIRLKKAAGELNQLGHVVIATTLQADVLLAMDRAADASDVLRRLWAASTAASAGPPQPPTARRSAKRVRPSSRRSRRRT